MAIGKTPSWYGEEGMYQRGAMRGMGSPAAATSSRFSKIELKQGVTKVTHLSLLCSCPVKLLLLTAWTARKGALRYQLERQCPQNGAGKHRRLQVPKLTMHAAGVWCKTFQAQARTPPCTHNITEHNLVHTPFAILTWNNPWPAATHPLAASWAARLRSASHPSRS